MGLVPLIGANVGQYFRRLCNITLCSIARDTLNIRIHAHNIGHLGVAL